MCMCAIALGGVASSIVAMLRALGFKRPHEPKPRFGHFAGTVGGECLVFAGGTRDFDRTKEQLSSTIEVFDQYLEQWREPLKTTGSPPKGLYYGGCCVSPSGDLYVYGGFDGSNRLYKLSSLKWSQLSGETDVNSPMKKDSCGIACFNKYKVAVIGGYGLPPASLQAGASFIEDKRFTSGEGWTNEIHTIDTNNGKLYFYFCIAQFIFCRRILEVLPWVSLTYFRPAWERLIRIGYMLNLVLFVRNIIV